MSNAKPQNARVTLPGSLNEPTRRMICAFVEELAGQIAYMEEQTGKPLLDPTLDPEPIRRRLLEAIVGSSRSPAVARPLDLAVWLALLWHAAGDEPVTPQLADPQEAPTETLGTPPNVTITPLEQTEPPEQTPAPASPAALIYPEQLTEGLRDALLLHPDDADKIFARLRLRDPNLPKTNEDALAYALHYVIPFAIRHDQNWREEARKALPPLPANHPRGAILR